MTPLLPEVFPAAQRRTLALAPADPGALEACGRLGGDLRWLRRAVAAAPDFVAAWINLAAAVMVPSGAPPGAPPGAPIGPEDPWNRRPPSAEAARALRRALALAPAADAAWFNLGVALRRGEDAAAAYRRTLAIGPGALDATANLGDVLRQGDPLVAALGPYRQALALAPAEPGLFKNLMFCLHYDPAAQSEALFALHRRWAALQPPADPRPHANPPEPGRRLRLGYLSGDLYDHPVGRNVLGLIESHDPAQVEIHLYAAGPAGQERSGQERPDPIAARLRAAARTWRVVTALDDAAVAELIRADGIDILVVLAGHTLFNRIAVAALKPAPVQVSLHDFTTSGLRQVDYLFGDPVLTPEGGPQASRERFTEEVVRLPFFSLYPPPAEIPLAEIPLAEIPLAEIPPAEIGARGAPLVLGSCSNPAKLNDRVIDLWARLLLALPAARLHLKYRDRFGDPQIQRRWRARLAAAGVDAGNGDAVNGDAGRDAGRVVFLVGDEDEGAHLAAVGTFDIALDPFPFNGCTTTFEALWMGVPVVTLAGRRLVGRMSATLLHQVGCDDLAVATEAAYVAAVTGLARDGERRARLRRELRGRLKASALLDAAGYARSVEAACRAMWRTWCDSQTKKRNNE